MTDFADHYDRLGELYATLGELDGAYCLGNRDFTGWYRSKPAAGEWAGTARPYALGREFDAMREDLERVVYATINYAPADYFLNSWDRYRWKENTRDWESGDNPAPGYGDLRGYAPFADIDLADSVKVKRPSGDIDRETIEAALSAYIDAFADLAGGLDHVYALDSVGGAYVFVAPSATTPIADAFNRSDRALIFEDLTGRLNDWLDETRDAVNDRLPDAEGVFEPDLVNNKNRLYKAPLSVHKSLPGVVTPIDRDRPRYDYRTLESVGEADVARAADWADGFTADHSAAVDGLVRALYPDHYVDADGWRPAVGSRLAELREARARNRKLDRERLPASELPDDLEETDDIEALNAKIEAIDVRDVARKVADEYDTAPGRDPPRFNPPWRASASGTSCYVDRDKWVDLEEGTGGGGALKLAARAAGILSHSSDQLRGDDYWKAVNELRKLGFDVPFFRGRDGTHPDGLRLFEEPEDTEAARRQVLRAMHAGRR